MPRRIGRPGLLGTAARTAVIAGTATAVSGGVARRGQQRAAAAQQQAAEQQAAPAQAAPAAPAAPAPAAPASGMSMDDKIAKLKELADLKAAGILTDAEFDAEKTKLLAL